MPVTVRPATLADAPAIAHVQVATWRTTYRSIVPQSFLDDLNIPTQTENWTEWLQLPNVLTFIAESDSAIIGFISGGPVREPHPAFDAELYAIYLLDPCQGQGTGRHLVRTLSTALVAHHFRSLLVWVLEANPAVLFYQALGATPQHRKSITLANTELPEISFGWPDLNVLTRT